MELVAEAIDARLSGRRSLENALANYEQQRNEMALPLYEYNAQAASMKPCPPEMQQLFAALQGNQEQTNRFFGIAKSPRKQILPSTFEIWFILSARYALIS